MGGVRDVCKVAERVTLPSSSATRMGRELLEALTAEEVIECAAEYKAALGHLERRYPACLNQVPSSSWHTFFYASRLS